MKKETIILIATIFCILVLAACFFVAGYYYHKQKVELQSAERPGQVYI